MIERRAEEGRGSEGNLEARLDVEERMEVEDDAVGMEEADKDVARTGRGMSRFPLASDVDEALVSRVVIEPEVEASGVVGRVLALMSFDDFFAFSASCPATVVGGR